MLTAACAGPTHHPRHPTPPHRQAQNRPHARNGGGEASVFHHRQTKAERRCHTKPVKNTYIIVPHVCENQNLVQCCWTFGQKKKSIRRAVKSATAITTTNTTNSSRELTRGSTNVAPSWHTITTCFVGRYGAPNKGTTSTRKTRKYRGMRAEKVVVVFST